MQAGMQSFTFGKGGMPGMGGMPSMPSKGKGKGQGNPNWHLCERQRLPGPRVPPPASMQAMAYNMSPPIHFRMQFDGGSTDMFMMLDDDGWCKLTPNLAKAIGFVEQVSMMGKVTYTVCGGPWDGDSLSVGDSCCLGVWQSADDAAGWMFDGNCNMTCLSYNGAGKRVSYKEDTDNPPSVVGGPTITGYLYASEGGRICSVAKEMSQIGGYIPPPPVYLAYKSPLQFVGFEANQEAHNPFAHMAAIDFRYSEPGCPFASRSLSVKASSAYPPAPEPWMHPALLPHLQPSYRYPGVAAVNSWGPLGIALENGKNTAPNRPMNMIFGLERNGAAERAGAKVGDIMVEINRAPLHQDSAPMMKAASQSYQNGMPVNFTILRGNQMEYLYLTPPPHHARPEGLGAAAGPNTPEPYPQVLDWWYHKPAGKGQVLE